MVHVNTKAAAETSQSNMTWSAWVVIKCQVVLVRHSYKDGQRKIIRAFIPWSDPIRKPSAMAFPLPRSVKVTSDFRTLSSNTFPHSVHTKWPLDGSSSATPWQSGQKVTILMEFKRGPRSLASIEWWSLSTLPSERWNKDLSRRWTYQDIRSWCWRQKWDKYTFLQCHTKKEWHYVSSHYRQQWVSESVLGTK